MTNATNVNEPTTAGTPTPYKPTTTGRLAHHKPLSSTYDSTILKGLTYGVPTARRLLTPGIFNRQYARIRDYLFSIGLTDAEREVALNLIRLYCYYGKVYPKASQFSEYPGCSRRTFWRAIAKLEELGTIDRINRYLHHRQISNVYRLDKLILILARYLAEHGYRFIDTFAEAILRMTSNSFWQTIWTVRVRLKDPKPITLVA